MTPTLGQPVLEVRDVAKSFGGVHAVRGVTFDVRQGEILGLIGPNGSGKSTLFNCILGQSIPTRGEVRIGGRSVTGLRPSELNRLGIGRTFQLLQVFPELTVTENPDDEISVTAEVIRLERNASHPQAALMLTENLREWKKKVWEVAGASLAAVEPEEVDEW